MLASMQPHPFNSPPHHPPPAMSSPVSARGDSRFDYENGRYYHTFRAGKYMFPCDEAEQERLDFQHQMMLMVRHNQLHTAPFKSEVYNGEPPRILDLGTGTGIWAIEMARKYPNCEVIGVDLADIQPDLSSASLQDVRNISFRKADYESEWTLGRNSFDLIHLRMALGSVSDWDMLWRRCFQHLKPMDGWLEYVEIEFNPQSEDDTLPFSCPLMTWARQVDACTSTAGKPFRFDPDTEERLRRAGFVDIQHQRIKIPLCGWSREKHTKDIGRYFATNMVECRGIEGYALAPLTRIGGWKPEEVRALCEGAGRDIKNRSYRAFVYCHVYTARRPMMR